MDKLSSVTVEVAQMSIYVVDKGARIDCGYSIPFQPHNFAVNSYARCSFCAAG